MRELASSLPEGEELISEANKGHWTLQQKMDECLQVIRRALQGQGEKIAKGPTANKVANFADANKFVKKSGADKYADANKFEVPKFNIDSSEFKKI